LNADPDPTTQINADPSGSGSETLVVRVLYLGSSKEESGLGYMILGNGSEDPDPDLCEPDPISVVCDDLFRAVFRVSLVSFH
jgi:hypothetical protein